MDKMVCEKCGGQMVKKGRAKHNQFGALIILIIGGALCFSPIFPLGIIMLIGGIAMACGWQKFWRCKKCGYFFDIK